MNAHPSPDSRINNVATNLLVRAQNTLADRDERGAAMAEYGLLLTFVGLAAVGILLTFGSQLKSTFAVANDTFANAPTTSN